MKKVLLIISILTTLLAGGCLIYSSSFFGIYLKAVEESKPGAQIAGVLFFIIFNFFTVAASFVNLIPNLIHFIKCKNIIVTVLFVIAVAILVASISMLVIFMYKNGQTPQKK